MVWPKVVVVAGLTLGLVGVAAAHHSGAAYDMEHPKTMEGTVKTVNWTNPHITFVIEADAKDGNPAPDMGVRSLEPRSADPVWLDQALAAARRSRGFSLRAASRRQSGRLPDESEFAGRQRAEFQPATRRSVKS